MNFNKNFYFVRHGNAAPATGKQKDAERCLTEQGKQQAAALAAKIGHPFRTSIVSPAKRTLETERIVGGNDAGKSTHILCELLTTKDPADAAILEQMYAQLGNAPYSAYAEHANRAALARFAQHAAIEIKRIVGYLGDRQEDVLVVGHAVLTNAIVAHMFPTIEVMKLMLKTQLGECGCILVQVDGEGFISAEILN